MTAPKPTVSRIRTLLRFAPAAAMALLIPLLSLLPAHFFKGLSRPLQPIPAWDKAVHAILYAALAATLFFASTPDARRRLRTQMGLAAAASLYGIVMEVSQAVLTSSRSMDPLDALANAAGAFLCLMLACAAARRHAPSQV